MTTSTPHPGRRLVGAQTFVGAILFPVASRSPPRREAGPAKLGFLGSVLITAGGLGAGSTRQHDPLLESLHMSWLRFGHGLVLSSILLWPGVVLMLIAWLRLGRRVARR